MDLLCQRNDTRGKDKDAGVSCSAENDGSPSGKGEETIVCKIALVHLTDEKVE